MDNQIISQIIDELADKVAGKLAAMLKGMPETKTDTVVHIEKPINTRQLCDYLNVTEPTILRWRQKGKIPFFTVGSAVRFHLKDVLNALDK